MLNDIIKIDLHIHSKISDYKEDTRILDKSTIENIDTLLKNLEEHQISLFAITDHNKFDFNLYTALVEELDKRKKEKDYIVKTILPGVEFDVKLEDNKDTCHIITLFNDKDITKVSKINQCINEVKEITKKEEFYSKEEFENILKKIGLETILIVHQKQDFSSDKKTHSLSNSCDNPDHFIRVGYINALEYTKPKIEGIVKNCLKDLNLDFPLITGSDCHTWENYPYHSVKGTEKKQFTSFKCLPTFKGLLLSITSFNTRANRRKNTNLKAIKNIKISDLEIPISNGINAIIGDNGSGKSLLLNYIGTKGKIKTIYKSIVKDNNITVEYLNEELSLSDIKYIEQGEINDKVVNATLFKSDDNNYYKDISATKTFKDNITKYFNELIAFVEKQISKEDDLKKQELNKYTIKIIDKNRHLPTINTELEEIINEHSERSEELEKIINTLVLEINFSNNYYEKYELIDRINKAKLELEEILKYINKEKKKVNNQIAVNAIVIKHLKNYETQLKPRRATEESEQVELQKEKNKFISSILIHIKNQNQKLVVPTFPSVTDGHSENVHKNYKFTKVAKYHKQNVKNDFFDILFKAPYNTETEFLKIKSKNDLEKAFKYGNYTELEDFKEKRLKETFLKDYTQETTSIKEVDTNSAIGNTPGQISLVFYKFTFQETEDEFSVILIDQPEDDINPRRIEKYLVNYLGEVRDKKQVILVTHNPLLVINLDVDNVIFLEKHNNKINAQYGALEYDKDYSILDLIRDNLEGGYDAIERRLKIYGKE